MVYYRFYSADVYMVCLYLIHMGILVTLCIFSVLHLFFFPQVGRGPSLLSMRFQLSELYSIWFSFAKKGVTVFF